MTTRAQPPPLHPFVPIEGHEHARRVLQAAVRAQRLAHAYLFTGPDAIGKRLVATHWAMAINCESPPSEQFGGCGSCRACTMALAGSHPDLIVIEPDGLFIKIEQIRALQAALSLTAWSGSRKIILIDRADRLNMEAANCLLKTLEEPPHASLLILISASPEDLLPTLRSRCHIIRFVPLDPEQLIPWLMTEQHWSADDATLTGAVAGGCIGKALAVDPATLREERDQIDHLIADSCLARTGTDRALSDLSEGAEVAAQTPEQFERTLRWLLLWLQDTVRLIVSTNTAGALPRFPSAQRAARQVPIAACSDLAAQLHWTWRASFRNINRQLLLEQWLIALRECCRKAPDRSRAQEPAAT
jgi:DNA polymerase-3 subunit delta'